MSADHLQTFGSNVSVFSHFSSVAFLTIWKTSQRYFGTYIYIYHFASNC